jgi:hypothetical protein
MTLDVPGPMTRSSG